MIEPIVIKAFNIHVHCQCIVYTYLYTSNVHTACNYNITQQDPTTLCITSKQKNRNFQLE